MIERRIEEAAEAILEYGDLKVDEQANGEPRPEVTVDLDACGDDPSGQFIQPLLLCSSLFHFWVFGAGRPEVAPGDREGWLHTSSSNHGRSFSSNSRRVSALYLPLAQSGTWRAKIPVTERREW